MVQHVEHLWTILSKGVSSDARVGLSLSGLIDMVHVPVLPANGQLNFDCYVLSCWRRNFDPGTTLSQRVIVEYQIDGRRWGIPGEETIVLEDRHLFCAIRSVQRLPIGGYGQHMVIVQRQDVPGAEWIDAPPTAGLWVASSEMLGRLPPRKVGGPA